MPTTAIGSAMFELLAAAEELCCLSDLIVYFSEVKTWRY